jgi:hypothetical protein
MSAESGANIKPTAWKRMRKAIAGVAATALATGLLIVAGGNLPSAMAATVAPTVTVTEPGSYIWGEDLPLTLNFEGTASAGAQYNVSVGIVIPATAKVQNSGTLGVPTVYAAGDPLPGQIVNDPTETCVSLGLAATDPESNTCLVPLNAQYLVFENVHDLPEGAAASHTLTLRPDADVFQLGDRFAYQVNAYTNGDERFLPVFPGSTGVNNAAARAESSNAGQAGNGLLVNALRITKQETTHPENEVLRGVHGDRGAIYELRIEHTGEADLSTATVVDYLPAGLEYLGSCGLPDSTTNANGTQDAEEYPGSGPLNTATVGADCLAEASIETVQGSLDSEGRFTESDSGDVFTAVTWNVGEWLMANPGGVEQLYPGTEGTPATTTIRYRAGVPLYENTIDFGETTPSPDSLEQGANLNNNRGASTRHGTDDLDARNSSDGAGAIGYTNGVIASGEYNGETVSDSTTESTRARAQIWHAHRV